MLFVGVNLLFTGIDVVLAHSINSYIPVYEWIPIIYFPLGSISCIIIALKNKPKKWQALIHIMLMITGVMVGVIGTAFHANAVLNPAGYLTWSWVVFGSPILAPLAFSGISLLGLYAVTEEVENQPGVLNIPGLGTFKAPISRERHFLWLVGLGFGASAITSIIDHAQYGYSFYKMIAIIFGLFSTSVVLYLSSSTGVDKGRRACIFLDYDHCRDNRSTWFWISSVCRSCRYRCNQYGKNISLCPCTGSIIVQRFGYAGAFGCCPAEALKY